MKRAGWWAVAFWCLFLLVHEAWGQEAPYTVPGPTFQVAPEDDVLIFAAEEGLALPYYAAFTVYWEGGSEVTQALVVEGTAYGFSCPSEHFAGDGWVAPTHCIAATFTVPAEGEGGGQTVTLTCGPPLCLDLEDAAIVGAAILLTWLTGWAWAAAVTTLRDHDNQ